ncbi:stage II sporulation protein M [Paenibacillus eucommiae]|uniref:Stage II sporulation protein M n=1 Tax=Paenibacillus eucommiae TaxID=1355755 RepID=A0ABS4J957_9BACL|nr:stage II sporulation protein M [Paenibacillus eucommiae]MBP1996388.1 stage II sporulation protein M [Paenibacillus eucommiae]
MKFRLLFNHFREMKHYFIAVAIVFATGIFLGWQDSGQFSAFLSGGVEKMKPISDFVNSKENPQLWLFIIIFANNFSISIMFIFLGLFFGILPLFLLVSNGMILGYVLSLNNEGSTFMLILKGILPHGIFELSAVMIACAYGIKLGSLVGKMLLHLIVRKVGTTARAEFIRILKLTRPLILFIACMLLVAAVVESTISYWLLGG